MFSLQFAALGEEKEPKWCIFKSIKFIILVQKIAYKKYIEFSRTLKIAESCFPVLVSL